jgi:FMN phosphatase YigB (HAD superfamily)
MVSWLTWPSSGYPKTTARGRQYIFSVMGVKDQEVKQHLLMCGKRFLNELMTQMLAMWGCQASLKRLLMKT